MTVLEGIFWTLLLILTYVYVGYPLVLRLTAAARRQPRELHPLPDVTLFIPAYNEASVIRAKIENSLALDYPLAHFQILLASDASTDDTLTIADEFRGQGVVVCHAPCRRGKNALINEYLPQCQGQIVVFTDANSLLRHDAINNLVRHFADETIGCVVGHLKYVNETTSVGMGESLYFRYEALLKQLESSLGAVVTGTGAIYAVRRNLAIRLDEDVPSDFAHPIQVAAQGYKVIFERDAVAYEPATTCMREEFERRARIVTRGVTAFLRYRRLYNMLTGWRGFCFISHKLLRWCIPLILIALLLTSAFLQTGFYRLVFLSQLAFYALAVIGALWPRTARWKVIYVPLYFCLANLAALTGLLRCLLGDRPSTWKVATTTR